MKKVIILASLIAASFVSHAQYKVGVFGSVTGTPSDLADAENLKFGNGVGGGISVRKEFTENIFIGGNLSFVSINNSLTVGDVSAWMLPLAAAGEYYFMTDKIKPYVGLEAGYGLFHFAYDIMGTSDATTDRGVYIAPNVGVAYGITDGIDLTLNAKYALFRPGASKVSSQDTESSNMSHWGVNLGFAFAIGK